MYVAVQSLISTAGMGKKCSSIAASEVSAAVSPVLTDFTKTTPKAP